MSEMVLAGNLRPGMVVTMVADRDGGTRERIVREVRHGGFEAFGGAMAEISFDDSGESWLRCPVDDEFDVVDTGPPPPDAVVGWMVIHPDRPDTDTRIIDDLDEAREDHADLSGREDGWVIVELRVIA